MQFAQAANYPVDLYYIMDLSQTMEDDRTNLAKLGNSIIHILIVSKIENHQGVKK